MPLVVLFSLTKGLLLAFLGDISGAPAWVVVTRQQDGQVVGRLSAGRDPGVGNHLLLAVRESMEEYGSRAFLQRWHLDKG